MASQPPAEVIAAAQAAALANPPIPASVLLGQWALESGWGAHMPPGSNNPFGEKALPGDPSVAAPTSEVVDGHLVPTNAPFRAFPSIAAAFAFHARHLATSHHFIAARACLPDVKAFCFALGGGTPEAPNYSTDPNYGARLWPVIADSNLIRFDPMTQTPAPPPVNAMPTYADQMVSVLLVGGLQMIHGLAPGQVNELAADGVSVIGVLYALFAANPTKAAPIAFLMSMLGRVPKPQQTQWNTALLAMKAEILAEVEARLNPAIRARAGLLGGPAVGLADKALATAAAGAADHLKIS